MGSSDMSLWGQQWVYFKQDTMVMLAALSDLNPSKHDKNYILYFFMPIPQIHTGKWQHSENQEVANGWFI